MKFELYAMEKTPFWQFTPEINQICQPLFEQFGLTYFDYTRFYPDRSCIAFSNNPEYVKYLITEKEYQCAAGLILPGKHLWTSFINLDFLHNTTQFFDYYHGITYHQYQPDYLELINFSTSRHRGDIISIYLNYPEVFEYFLTHFRELIAPFLKKHRHARILLPSGFLPNQEAASSPLCIMEFIQQLNKNYKLRKNTFQFKMGNKLVPLTLREMDCLMYLTEGLAAKEIARKMAISPRTVEIFSKKLCFKAEVTTRAGLLSKLDYQTLKLFSLLVEAKRDYKQ